MTNSDDWPACLDSFCIDPIFGDVETEQWLLSKNPEDFRWAVEDDQLPEFEKPKRTDFLDILIQAAEDLEKEEIIEEGKVGEKKPEPEEIIQKTVQYVFIGRTKKKAPLQKTTLDQFFSKKTKLEKV